MAKSACTYAERHQLKENLNDLLAFIAVARERNFTRAAAQIGISQSALSRTIRTLEQQMNVPLLVRTTRSVSLTEAGERLLLAIEPKLQEIDEELESLRALTSSPAGTVRISATDHAIDNYIWPRVQYLLREYPDLKIEFVNDYRLSDIVADRYDIGVRLGEGIAKDMIAARIAPDLTMAVVGAPSYLESHEFINSPQDLAKHNCITLRLPTKNSLLPWELKKGSKQLQLKVDGQLTFDNVYKILEAAVAGFGLAYIPMDMAESHVESGRLRWVLEEWYPTYIGLHVYYPHRQKSSRAVELVVGALKSGYKGTTAT
ncbi:LysR family transcriptional regulator [Pseudomonas sp. NPDC089547]|uniref:LysR family transcriptional regulator n=1 Tax=Pseudomonas sp. NPDC089547 TaxID=3390652 RepID=UPI003D01E815